MSPLKISSSRSVACMLLASISVSTWTATATAQLARDPEAEAAYNQGMQAFEQEKFNEAIDQFARALSIDDTYADAYAARGDALKAQDDYSGALQSYRQAIDVDANMARAYNGRGECYRELGQIDLAFNDFNNAIDLDHQDPSILANLGRLHVDNRDPVRGLPYLDKAIEQDPKNAKALRSRGFAEALLQRFDDAVIDFEKSIEADPDDYQTYSTLANVHVFAKDLGKAIDAITKAIEKYNPEKRSDPSIFYNGYLQRARWRSELAKEGGGKEEKEAIYELVIADCESVLKEYPDTYPQSGEAMFFRGIAKRMLGRFSEAIKSLTDAIQAAPMGEQAGYAAEAYLRRGICWHYQGQDALAQRDFHEAIGLNYEDALAYFWLGVTYSQEEDYREAIRYYGDAIAKNHDYSLAYVNRGLAYLKLEEYQKAVDNFNEAIGVEPDNPEHFYKRGIAHLYLEEYQKAADSFALAILWDPGHVKSFRGMERALKGLDKPELGEEYRVQAEQLEQGSQQKSQ